MVTETNAEMNEYFSKDFVLHIIRSIHLKKRSDLSRVFSSSVFREDLNIFGLDMLAATTDVFSAGKA